MNPTTEDTPQRLAILPDWREGIRLTQEFASVIQTGRLGLEQRSRRRKRPIYQVDFMVSGLTSAEARGRIEEIRNEFIGPRTVPMWTHGITLQTSMVDDNAALLESNPIEGEWNAPFDVYLWSDELGGEWRECLSVTGRNLVLDGVGTLYPAGAWVFPSRTMIRQASDSMMTAIDIESGTENHLYRSL